MAAAAASKVFLTMHGVERDDVAGHVEFLQKLLHRRDFVGLFLDLDMRQNQGRIGGKGTEHLLGLAVVEGVEAAAKRLAVERQRAGTGAVQVRRMFAKDLLHAARIEFAQDRSDRGVRGRPLPANPKSSVEPSSVYPDEGADAAIRVGPRNHRQDCKQQHIALLVAFAFGAPRVRNGSEKRQEPVERFHRDGLQRL